MKAPLLFATIGLAVSPLLVAEAVPNEVTTPLFDQDLHAEAVDVPEPNTMLFAGLGSLVVLMVAIRRK